MQTENICLDQGTKKKKKERNDSLALTPTRTEFPSVNVTARLQILLNMAFTTVLPDSVRSGQSVDLMLTQLKWKENIVKDLNRLDNKYKK